MRRPLVIDPGLVYSSYLGGHGGEGGFNAVSVDPRGNVYVAGCTGASDYPTTPGSFQPIDPGPAGEEAVITKLSKDGSTLVYSTYLGRSRSVDQISDVVVEKGFAHGGGTTNSQNFPTTPGTIEPADPDPLPGAAARDYFVAKLQTEPAVPTPQRGGADLRGRPAAAPHTSTRAPRPTAGA